MKLKHLLNWVIAFSVIFVTGSCSTIAIDKYETSPEYNKFQDLEKVVIHGYLGEARNPFITPDGEYLLFNNNPDENHEMNIRYARFINKSEFSYQGRLVGTNTPGGELSPSVDELGTIYYGTTHSIANSRPAVISGRFTGSDVLSTRFLESKSIKDFSTRRMDLSVNYDGSRLFYVSQNEELLPLLGSTDISVAKIGQDGLRHSSRESNLLKNVNSPADEYSPFVSRSGLELFFVRQGSLLNSKSSIYVSQRDQVGEPFGVPRRVNIPMGYVGDPVLSPDGRFLYFHAKRGDEYLIFRMSRPGSTIQD